MSTETDARRITDKLHALQEGLTPALRKSTKAATTVFRKAIQPVTPMAKKPRTVDGVTVMPGLMRGSVGESVWHDATTGTVHGKVGLNVNKTKAPSKTSGVPGKHKAYWGTWNTRGTDDRYTGSKTRRSRASGVLVVRKVSTGNVRRYTGRIKFNGFLRAAAAASFGTARAAARSVIEKTIKDIT